MSFIQQLIKDMSLNKNVLYRLHYIGFEKRFTYGIMGERHLVSDKFVAPNAMSSKDVYKTLSFITDYIKSSNIIKPITTDVIKGVITFLEMPESHFEFKNAADTKAINLYTIYSSEPKYFNRSAFKKDYFDWYSEGVTMPEVSDIYAKYGLEFNQATLQKLSGRLKDLSKSHQFALYAVDNKIQPSDIPESNVGDQNINQQHNIR